ncbi:MAG TPA: hypothetical protein VHL09_04430 [Dehalococcoidia bacterium]|nr:hypothetical protein [Dehalococcoidia bacterium]
MDSSRSTDPLAQWRSFYNQAEQAWTDFVQRMISTPGYADAMGRTSQTMLNSLEAWRGVADRYLTEVWNVPTRNDLGRLGEVVVAIDAKADDLDDRLDLVEATLARVETRLGEVDRRLTTLAADGPIRVQERSEVVDRRLDGLERRLDDLLSRTEQIAKLVEESGTPARANGGTSRGSSGESRTTRSRAPREP